tara:strand:- start:610 stop:990 length:381 start_codon:yes stop_codon:yes gene_type:complete
MKKIIVILALISTPLLAQVDRPEDMVDQQVPILLHCFPSFARVVEILGRDYQEAPVMLSQMSDTTTMVWFTNKDRSTSTLVVTKSYKDSESSCIMWNGSSEPGLSFSLNPEPNFPKPPPAVGWNEA